MFHPAPPECVYPIIEGDIHGLVAKDRWAAFVLSLVTIAVNDWAQQAS